MRSAVSVGGLKALSFSFVLAVVSAQATDYYVSTSGSDSNPGTSAQPYRTITHAYARATAGTTIYVAPGTYTDYTSGWGIHLGSSGSSSSPITLKSQVRGGAIIDGGNVSDRNQGFYIDGSYNVVDGFEIRNCPKGGISIWANGNRIINNEIHHNGNPADPSTNGRDGVYSNEGTSGNYYANNSIHDNGRSGSNLDHGLYLCGQNETVINNVLFRNSASGLQVAGYTTVANMKVYNNVMAWNGTSGIIIWQSMNGVDIKNNMIYQNGHWGVDFYAATGSGVVLDHNLCYANAYGNYNFTDGGSTCSYTQGTSISSDPRFVNNSSATFDAHLAAGSPAILAGLNLYSSFTTDLNGTVRPAIGAWDLGAYVYGIALNTPPTISSIANQSVMAGNSTSPLGFTVSDGQTPASSLTISASSSNPTLVPNANVVLGGSSTNRTVRVTSATNQTGSATITLQVSDGQTNAATSFLVTVNRGTTLKITRQSGTVQLRWPTNSGNYVLQSKLVTSPTNAWTDVTNAVGIDQDQRLVTYTASGTGRLFRLRSQ